MSKFFETCNKNSVTDSSDNFEKVLSTLNALYRLSNITQSDGLGHILYNVALSSPKLTLNTGNIVTILQNTHQTFCFNGKFFSRSIGKFNIAYNTAFDVEFILNTDCKISFDVCYSGGVTYKCEIFLDVINLKHFMNTYNISNNTVRALMSFTYFRKLLGS